MVAVETAAMVVTIAITGTLTAMRTAATMAKAHKVFREGAIIVVGEKIVIVVAMIFKKCGAASFNRGKKYILINSDALAFA